MIHELKGTLIIVLFLFSVLIPFIFIQLYKFTNEFIALRNYCKLLFRLFQYNAIISEYTA